MNAAGRVYGLCPFIMLGGAMMKKGETYEGIVEKVLFPNKGLVKIEDAYATVKTQYQARRCAFM